MLKKIVALLLALSICIIPVYAEETAAQGVVLSAEREAAVAMDDYLSAYGLITAIAPEVTVGLSTGNVTRGEFVTRLMKLLKVEPISPITHYFADVDTSSTNSPYIHTAAMLGWVSMVENFEPDVTVQLDQAYKIIVSALGYTVAAQTSGGWAAGYIKMANTMELSSGLTTSTNVDDVNMIMLFANILEVGYTEDKIVTYNKNLPENYMNVIYDTYKAEGVINKTRYNSLEYGTEISADNTLEISGVAYTYDASAENTPVYNLLGYNVKAYYMVDGDYKNIVYLDFASRQNVVNVLKHNNYIDLLNDVINYDTDSGDIKEYRLDSGCIMVVNGRTLEEVDKSYFGMPGYSNLLDNDGDRDIDIIQLTGYTYLTVSNVDAYDSTIGDTKSSENSLKLENNVKYKTLWVKDAEGKNGTLSSISVGDVLQVARSVDGALVSLEILPELSGVVEEYTSDGSYVINGSEYKTSQYFDAYFSNLIYPGADLTFAIGYDNTLAAVTNIADAGFQYAYLLDLKPERFFTRTLKLKVVNSSANVVVYTTGEKIMLDGNKNATIDDCITKLRNNVLGQDINQVIKIAFDEDGKVAKIDTAEVFNQKTYGAQKENPDDSLIYFPNINVGRYRAAENMINGYINGNGTKMFIRPTVVSDDSKDYRFEIMNSTHFSDNKEIKFKTYDFNEDTAVAGLIVIEDDLDESFKDIKSWEHSYFIDRVYETVDEDGKVVIGLSAYKEGTWYNFTLDPSEVTYTREVSPTIKAGDFARLMVKGNEVKKVDIDFNYDTMSYSASLETANIEAASALLNYTIGVPYTAGGGVMRIITPSMKTDGEWECDIDKLRTISSATTYVLKYNCKTGKCRAATIDDMKTIKNYGIEDADFIAVLQRYGGTKTVVLFEDWAE